MSYEVRPPSVGAAFGAGLGSGLSDQIPREVERYRLSSGLKRFADQSQDLDPVQAMAQLSGIPGMTPQMIQSMGELLKRRAYGGALRGRAGQVDQQRGGTLGFPNDPSIRESPRENIQRKEKGSFLGKDIAPEDIFTLVSPETVEAGLNPAIPRTEEEIRYEAQQLPFYDVDPQGAIEIVRAEDASRVARNENLMRSGQIQEAHQEKISKGLRGTADRFGGVGPEGIPENVYLDIENKAIDAVAKKKMNPDQAAKHFAKEIDEIGRDYQSTKGLGDWLMAWGDPKQTIGTINNLQDKFKKRGDLRNWRDTLVGNNGLSWPMASSLAYPVNENKKMYNYIKSLPKIDFLVGKPPSNEKQEQIFSNILENMNENTSPLSVAHYLQRKGYDHTDFLQKLMKNRDELKGWQIDELSKPFPGMPKLNDLWLMSQIGVD